MTGSYGPLAVAEGPTPLAPLRSLLNSVELAEDAGDRWINGIALRPWSAQCASTYDYCGAKPAAMIDGRSATPTGSAAENDVGSFLAYVAETCTTRGLNIAELRQRATTLLGAVEPAAVEKELEKGAAMATPNPFLADGSATFANGDTAATAILGLAQLETGIAGTCRRGMIHAPVAVVTAWAAKNLVMVDPSNSARLINPATGTIIVPGQGYTGAVGTAGGWAGKTQGSATTFWAYATGMVEIRRSGIELDPPGEAIETLIRSTNDITYRATRYYNIAWDRALQLAAKIDIAAVNP